MMQYMENTKFMRFSSKTHFSPGPNKIVIHKYEFLEYNCNCNEDVLRIKLETFFNELMKCKINTNHVIRESIHKFKQLRTLVTRNILKNVCSSIIESDINCGYLEKLLQHESDKHYN